MGLKEYFDIELITAIITAVIAAVVGYISFIINEPLSSLGLAIVVLAIYTFLFKTIMKIQKERKWWISNCVVVFLLVWFIVWAIFYNLRLM